MRLTHGLSPRLGNLIDEAALRAAHRRRPSSSTWSSARRWRARIRLPDDQAVGSLNALELLEIYWRASHVEDDERQALGALAGQVIQGEAEI